jgi:septal ring factor EnvC (AmiA/AmiB activator)
MNNFRTVREARINFLFFQDIITCVMGILILITLMLSLSLDTSGDATPEEQQLKSDLGKAKESLAQAQQQNQSLEKKALRLTSLPDRPALETEITLIEREINQSNEQLRRAQEAAIALQAQQDLARQESQSLTNLQRAIATLQSELNAARAQLAAERRQTNSLYVLPATDAAGAHEPVVFVVGNDKIQVHRFNNSATAERAISSAQDAEPLLASLNPSREYVVLYFRPSGAKWFEPLRALIRARGFTVGYDAIEEQKQLIFSTQ